VQEEMKRMTVSEICSLTAVPEQRMTGLKCSEDIMEQLGINTIIKKKLPLWS
jgi:hypothetical protein